MKQSVELTYRDMASLVSRGVKVDDLGSVNRDLVMNQPEVVNADEVFAGLFERLRSERRTSMLDGLPGHEGFVELFNKLGLDVFSRKEGTSISLYYLERVVEKKMRRAAMKQRTTRLRMANRAEYTPDFVVTYERKFSKEEGRGWFLGYRYDPKVRPQGILVRSILHRNPKAADAAPIVLRLENTLLREIDTEDGEIPVSEFTHLRARKWMVSQGSLLWNMQVPGVKEFLFNAFPEAINLTAYNHRLDTSLVPGGFLPEQTIGFSNPMAVTLDGQVVDQKCDGAGLYDPDHPAVQDLVSRFGKVPYQITAIRQDGLFCKGILVPREGINGGDFSRPAFWFDMDQVKGSWKKKVSEGQVEANVDIGVMSTWAKRGTYPLNFENLQFLRVPEDSEEGRVATEDMKSLIDEAIDSVLREGVMGLAKAAAKDDESLQMILKLVVKAREQGLDMNPMAIPLLRDAMEDLLQKRLWLVGQGLGFEGTRYVTVLDASVPEGEVVLSGFKPGTELALWRFPCVLPQGNVVCRVRLPAPHQLVDGKPIQNTAFLNPRDLTLRMQGDDDGDVVGVTDDARVVRLFKRRITERLYYIESPGDKFPTKSNTRDGQEYMQVDPRGPVGITTMWQARLLAAGDLQGAIAMGYVNQCAIDMAKKAIPYPDLNKLLHHAAWIDSPEFPGALKVDKDYVCPPATGKKEDFPQKAYANWVKGRLAKFGVRVVSDKKLGLPAHVVLAWRLNSSLEGKELKKRVSPWNWQVTTTHDGGWGKGNLVHRIWNYACRSWNKKIEQARSVFHSNQDTVDVRTLLITLAAANGIELPVPTTSWMEYLKNRKIYGLDEYSNAMAKAMKLKSSLDDSASKDQRTQAVEDAIQALQAEMLCLTPAQIHEIWWHELTPVWKKKGEYSMSLPEKSDGWWPANKPKLAFRCLAFPGSPLLKICGIEEENACGWLGASSALTVLKKGIRDRVARGEEPWTWVAEAIHAGKKHGDWSTSLYDNAPRVELVDCDHCKSMIMQAGIQAYRDVKGHGLETWVKNFVTDLNKNVERPVPVIPPARESLTGIIPDIEHDGITGANEDYSWMSEMDY